MPPVVTQLGDDVWVALLEAGGAVVCRVDAESLRCHYVSPGVQAVTGWTQAEWLAPDFWVDHLHPDDRAWLVPARTAALETLGRHAARYRVHRRDGGWTWFSCAVQRVEHEDAPAELVAVMHDVTAARAAPERVRAEQAEASLARLQSLNAAALAVHRQHTVDGVLQALTDQAAAVVGAEQAVSSLTTGLDWSQSVAAVQLGDRYAAFRDYAADPDGSGIYTVVTETGQPLRLSQAQLEAHPRWRGFGAHAGVHPPMRGWLAVPLVGRDGRGIGLVQLSDKRGGGDFDDQDEAVLVQLAQLASLALEKAVEYAREHEVAVALQRSLLPHALPDRPGLSCHVVYAPGETDVSVGGDFYDVFEVDAEHVALALGDVVGHGLRSASLMGQVRSALRGLAVRDRDPAAVVDALDRLVGTLGDEAMATLAYGLLHVPSGRLELVLAGHPPPLLRCDGRVGALASAPGLPLGALPGGGYTASRHVLPPGADLLLFSDGLVETRARSLGEGLAALEAALLAAPAGLEALCAEVLAELAPGAHEDDVALLAVRLG